MRIIILIFFLICFGYEKKVPNIKFDDYIKKNNEKIKYVADINPFTIIEIKIIITIVKL